MSSGFICADLAFCGLAFFLPKEPFPVTQMLPPLRGAREDTFALCCHGSHTETPGALLGGAMEGCTGGFGDRLTVAD